MSHIKSPTQTKKKSFNTEITYYLIIQKEYALRELTQLYSFTGLQVIQMTPHTENTTKEQKDFHLKNQITKSTTTKNNNKKSRSKYISKRKKK